MKGMPPKLVSDDGKHVVIRPLAHVRERDLARWAAFRDYPIIPCDLCGSQENLKRREMKAMIADWERRFPGRVKSIAAAMQAVTPSHLMDRSIFPFEGLRADGQPSCDGDIAFDEDPCATPGASFDQMPLSKDDAESDER
jgi:tRNA 2-thiocytidine biosynthesis protein TtcA